MIMIKNKIIFLIVLCLLFSGVSAVMADTSVQSPATFTLKVDEKATVTNVLNMRIKLQKINTETVGTLIGYEPGQPDPNTYGVQKSVEINVATDGGCGPNADPRCLGMPAFQENYTLYENASITALALNIKVINISNDSATFAIGLPDIIPSNPAPVPGVSPANPVPIVVGIPGGVGDGSDSGVFIPSAFNLPKGQEVVSTEKIEATPDTPAHFEVKAKKKVRLFFIFPVFLETIYSVNVETGESKVLKRSWWSFLAR